MGTNISVNAADDGFVACFPKGGVAPYTFLWDDIAGSTTQSVTDLPPGTYTVTVTDSTAVTPLTTTGQVTLTEPAAL